MSADRKMSRRRGSKEWRFARLLSGLPLCWPPRLPKPKPASRPFITGDHPNGTRMCQNCKFFISGGGGRSGMMGCPMGGGGMMGRGMMGAGACQLVEGRISPMGYCDLYGPLGALGAPSSTHASSGHLASNIRSD